MMILLSTVSVIRHLICDNNYNWFLNLNLIYATLWTGTGSGLLISIMIKTQLVLFDQSNNGWIKMDGSVLEGKSSFKMLGLTFSSKLDRGSYILSITKSASKKIEASICTVKFFSLEIALYLYKSIIPSCTEYCCHVWVGCHIIPSLVLS